MSKMETIAFNVLSREIKKKLTLTCLARKGFFPNIACSGLAN